MIDAYIPTNGIKLVIIKCASASNYNLFLSMFNLYVFGILEAYKNKKYKCHLK